MKSLFTIAFFVVLASCGSDATRENSNPLEELSGDSVFVSPQQQKASGIQLGKIEMRSLSGGIPVTGMLDVPPQNLVNITAPLGGFLRSTSLLQGMRITKGQVLAVIENPEYIQLQQDFLDTRSQVTYLEQEYQRQEKLSVENVNSQKTLQRSLADLESMKARRSGLAAKLRMLGLDPDQLKPEEIRSTIELRSTINGFVTRVNSAVGAFIDPTEVMFTIVDTDHLHAELTCFERDIPRIHIGQKVRFQLAHEATERTASIFLVGREITRDRTVRVHAHLDKEDRDLMPGMFLKAIIQTGSANVPSLPEEAVLNFEDKEVIFVQAGESVYRMVEVTTGMRENGFVEVIVPSDIKPEQDGIVIRNAYKLLSKLKSSEGEE
ncbi:MAG: efflux RND transporter periplasmic adaptor subunit [Cyclobacteriaceae bacterium]|nr:efflux RND transporter periplasmic adaptor subunit [Cyclobacteriaceae bacterium]